MELTKINLLKYFRNEMDKFILTLPKSNTDKNKKSNAGKVNKHVKKLRDDLINSVTAEVKEKELLLEKILLLQYVTYVIMLEYRNKVWEYEYMAFSRRIGEIWEEFCKIPFDFPANDIEIIEPIDFQTHKKEIQQEVYDYIFGLDISDEEKNKIQKYFDFVWMLLESGEINLSLDLHFKTPTMRYNVDYKSGFSSNEKGNTSRLLLVGNIYDCMETEYENLIFVRQNEEENNHYFQTLKNSPYWTAYCGEEAYKKIGEFTGVNLRKWMNDNIDWHNDISNEFKEYLSKNDILKYLTW